VKAADCVPETHEAQKERLDMNDLLSPATFQVHSNNERALVPLTAPTEQAVSFSDWTLDQIGAEDEEIKNRCIDLVEKVRDLCAVKDHFVDITNWISHVLAAREQTNAALVERGMMIAMTEGALADLKEENRALYEEREEARTENSLLASENLRLRETTQAHEARIETLEVELGEAQSIGAQFHEAYESERAQVYHLKGDLDDLQDAVTKNDKLITQLQLDLATARDEGAFARQHADVLQSNLGEAQAQVETLGNELAESQVHAAGLADRIRELEIVLESERRQIAKLEELIASSHMEHQKAQAALRADRDDDRRQIADLGARLDEQTARALAADRLLAEARADLQEKTDRCRVGERQAQEMDQKLLRLSEHSEAAAADMAHLKEKLEARERAHARLGKRARMLIRAMRDVTARLEKSEQKAAFAAERLSAERGRFADQQGRLEQTIRDLVEQLEKERASNRVAAGALEAARQQRLQPRDEEPGDDLRIEDILARAEKMRLAAEAAHVHAPINA
jgi:FtsZ-binding cell division protein ZapB